MKVFLRQIYSYNFHFFKLNNLKVIHDLYSQYLTQILSKTSYKSYMEGVHGQTLNNNPYYRSTWKEVTSLSAGAI